MATTFKELQDRVLKQIALSDNADARTECKRWLNAAARDVWTAYPWRERKTVGYVNTSAPYTTGTADFTNGSTTVTGNGTTWTSGMVGRKIALDYDSPYYVISAFVSATEVTLARAYVESTASAQTYTIYDDVIALTDMDTLLASGLIIFNTSDDQPLTDLSSGHWDEPGHFPRETGSPRAFRIIEDSGSATVIQVWPVPDAAYGLRYPYLKPYTDMVSPGDTCDVPESRRDIVYIGALRDAYPYIGEDNKGEAAEARFERRLRFAWSRERGLHPQTAKLRGMDHPAARHGRRGTFTIDWP